MTPPTLPSPEDQPLEAARLEDDEPLRQWLMVNPPQPLGPPHVDPALPQLSGLERAAEVLRYTAQCTEHWLSPHGTLREWFRRNLRLAFAVVIPLLVMAPVVTLLFDQLRGWSASALDIATNLARMPAVTFTMLLSAAGVFLYRWLLR